MRIDCLLLRRLDSSVASNGMTAVHIGVGRSRASRFDRIVPAVRPDKVSPMVFADSPLACIRCASPALESSSGLGRCNGPPKVGVVYLGSDLRRP